MHVEQDLIVDDIETTKVEIRKTITIVVKSNNKIARYTKLEKLVITQIEKNKRQTKEKNRIYEVCIEIDISQSL